MINKLKKITDIDVVHTVYPLLHPRLLEMFEDRGNNVYEIAAPDPDLGMMWLMSNQCIMVEYKINVSNIENEWEQVFIPMSNIISCSRIKDDEEKLKSVDQAGLDYVRATIKSLQ